jgi:LDH2 family malate/lactate/ureidoglycolate dehydrogenase
MAGAVVNDEKLKNFTSQIFQKLGVSKDDSDVTADILVASDLRGIPSHGVARLKRYYDGIKNGLMIPDAKSTIEKETPSTAAINANNGLGQPAGYFGMNLAIQKAKETGLGFVTVAHSNHYGIAGYYSMMALEEGDLIGISMTNSAPLVVPTFSKDMLIGTNPISIAAPCAKERPFVLDMATSVVPRGKFEVYERENKPVPFGWAVDEQGVPSTDTKKIIENMAKTLGGGILPLGGAGELQSGHKGYGMSLMVDILSGVLSGAKFGPFVKANTGGEKFINVGHFFGVIKIENFIDLDQFKKTMDKMIQNLKNSQKAKGENRVYLHGEKEFEKWDDYKKNGVPLQDKVVANLQKMAEETGVSYGL